MYNIRKTDLTQNRCCLFLVSSQEEVSLASSWQKVRLVIFRQKMCTVSRPLLMLRYPFFCRFPFFLLFLLRVFLFFLFTPSRENEKREGLFFTNKVHNAPKEESTKRCRHTPLRFLYLVCLCVGIASNSLISQSIHGCSSSSNKRSA